MILFSNQKHVRHVWFFSWTLPNHVEVLTWCGERHSGAEDWMEEWWFPPCIHHESQSVLTFRECSPWGNGALLPFVASHHTGDSTSALHLLLDCHFFHLLLLVTHYWYMKGCFSSVYFSVFQAIGFVSSVLCWCPNHFICLVMPLPARLLQHLFPLELREAAGFLHFLQLPFPFTKGKRKKKLMKLYGDAILNAYTHLRVCSCLRETSKDGECVLLRDTRIMDY